MIVQVCSAAELANWRRQPEQIAALEFGRLQQTGNITGELRQLTQPEAAEPETLSTPPNSAGVVWVINYPFPPGLEQMQCSDRSP